MAAADATQFIVKNQAYRLTGAILNGTTGNEITGGLTTLTASVSKDGETTFTTTTNAATERGTTGWFDVDLTATEMNSHTICVRVTAANSDAVYYKRVLVTADLSEPDGHARDSAVLRLEQFIVQTHMYFFNQVIRAIGTGTISLYNFGASAVKTTMARLTGTDTMGKGEG